MTDDETSMESLVAETLASGVQDAGVVQRRRRRDAPRIQRLETTAARRYRRDVRVP